jgi:hypothetical protein
MQFLPTISSILLLKNEYDNYNFFCDTQMCRDTQFEKHWVRQCFIPNLLF